MLPLPFIVGMRLAVFGPPASGKGTISRWISRDFNLPPPISTGDLLRQSKDPHTHSLLSTGNLLPDELVIPLLKHSLTGLDRWILDGFPRTLSQARLLDSFAPPDLAICIQVPESVIMDRMSSRWIHPPSGRTYNDSFNRPKRDGFDDVTGEPLVRRTDDQSLGSIKQRLDVFALNTLRIRPFYGNRWIELQGDTSSAIYAQLAQLFRERIVLKDGMAIPS